MTDFQVRAVEVDVETVQIVLVEEPRITSGGRPIGTTRIVTLDRGDDAIAPIVEDMLTTLNDYAKDILQATAEDQTQSLDEYEATLEDDDLGLGMGDERPGDGNSYHDGDGS